MQRTQTATQFALRQVMPIPGDLRAILDRDPR